MDEKVVVDGVKRVVSKLLARRKLKRSYEYEVQWEGQPSSSDYTAWLSRDRSVPYIPGTWLLQDIQPNAAGLRSICSYVMFMVMFMMLQRGCIVLLYQ